MKNRIKTLCLVAIAAATITTTTAAEKSKKEVASCEFSLTIDCEGCVKKVMNTIPYQKGVKNVDVDLKTKSATVEFDPSKSSQEAIVKAFSKIDIKATAKKSAKSECQSKCCSK